MQRTIRNFFSPENASVKQTAHVLTANLFLLKETSSLNTSLLHSISPSSSRVSSSSLSFPESDLSFFFAVLRSVLAFFEDSESTEKVRYFVDLDRSYSSSVRRPIVFEYSFFSRRLLSLSFRVRSAKCPFSTVLSPESETKSSSTPSPVLFPSSNSSDFFGLGSGNPELESQSKDVNPEIDHTIRLILGV